MNELRRRVGTCQADLIERLEKEQEGENRAAP
jgi:hypothetical protein